ncbi:GNAT family N-acetyltransferase [Ovoidimarina sediminis]|uniref:GNAT family N-acetyltransferase n=1 Tax=Ovoidimarina sediminis TaxID=3079856 RepID=UPI0029137121|nr:GNAT family N-acetyltransferase [Rhodophyticola sp. MJ-SS7]MDU8943636.1 GNAT family N-acetyltransferase [Rhodophyticola sp. MJ-SS7]
MIPHLGAGDLVLETPRLTLSPITMADRDIAVRVLCDPAVMHYITEVPMTVAEVDRHMPNAVLRGAGGRIGIWVIRRRDTGEKIGDCLLMPVPIDEDDYDWSLVRPGIYPPGQIEIGYLLVPEAWGQGFATEACGRLLRFAFEETALTDVVATTDPENSASQAVLGKCGLKPLGLKRAYASDNVAWFGITREGWLNRDGAR